MSRQRTLRLGGILAGLAVILFLAAAPAAAQPPAAGDSKPLVYPEARKSDVVDDYHGTKVADPYRWLEDPDSAETRAWVEAENKVTFGYLEQIPAREKIRERLTKLWNYEKYGMPYKRGNRYFYSKNDGLQNQSVLYTAKSLTDKPTVLLDPNTLSKDGTVALAGTAVSRDGKLMAYGLAASGSDWTEWHVKDVSTGKDLSDHLKWVKFSGASWSRDGKGFYYSRYDEPDEKTKLQQANLNQKMYYHRIGTPQSADELVYERPDQPKWMLGGGTTDDGRYLIIYVSEGSSSHNRLFYKDLQQKDAQVVELITAFEAQYSPIDNDGPVFYVETNLDAPRGRVIAIDIRRPDKKFWREIIPQAEETLQGASLFGKEFIVTYLKDAHTQVKRFDLTGKLLGEVKLPGIGSAGGFGGERKDKETFYSFTSYTTPATIYRYDIKTGRSTLYKRPKVDFNPDDYETKQVFYPSKDGTKIPMFITCRKGLQLDGTNPTYLYGYGGFNASMTPYFSVSNLVWMEMGGVYALANLRGGGEYGEEWHQAGTKLKKQNVFDDFIAAAEWLIANKYTSTPKLAIGGHSNGGLLVGACITQRPELYGAALAGVGVMDMLRFHKFTIGWAWVADFGSADNPEEFKAIYAYSPLHNIKPGTCYPPTLITTADHDDRVVPAHSFKFAATIQAAQGCDNPVIIRIETKAGHGGGKPTTKAIEEITDEYAFFVRTLHMDVK